VDESDLEKWQEHARALHRAGESVVIAEHPVFGILELGCWMCGYDDFLLRLAADPDFVRAFFDKILSIQMDVIEAYYGALGPYISLTTSGDDFGTQLGPFISPEMFGELVAPWFAARIARTKELTGAYYWHHSCGSVFALLPQLLECGVDILNPIQTSSLQMAPDGLKAAFGDRLVFWGAVDVQQFLPKATPEEVQSEVRRLVATLGRDGGYVTAPAHEMQDDVPPENMVAWIQSVREGADSCY
jgi:uroporphyrinogen decarboxylase